MQSKCVSHGWNTSNSVTYVTAASDGPS
jgi:hypothetical protein